MNFRFNYFYLQRPIRWFEPETYRASVAAAGIVSVLQIGEIDDPE